MKTDLSKPVKRVQRKIQNSWDFVTFSSKKQAFARC